jgi:hypothetical protein
MAPPPCRRLGRHCRALDVTLRVAALEGDEDHDATWLFGHTQRIDFGRTFEDDGELWCEATLHVPCRHLVAGEDGAADRCAAHGFRGRVPRPRQRASSRRLGKDRFELFEKRRLVRRTIEAPRSPRRALPLAPDSNPCAHAPCETSDHVRHAACCRDLQVEVRCTERQTLLEALLRNRKSPYLCKVEREKDEEHVLVAEMISACSFLKEDGLHCDLHGRKRADGRPAKPKLCSTWPEKRSGLHPGCAFRNTRLKLNT